MIMKIEVEKGEMVMPSKTGPLGGLAHSVVDYVISRIKIILAAWYTYFNPLCQPPPGTEVSA
jgi:hypothetical protein